jgi:predicted Fe-Mo cluster-binding NifX family protein
MKKPEIERIGFGVTADKDIHPRIFSHSDRFLVVDLKLRKEIILREHRPNPYGKICREKYTMPSLLGDHPSDEELEIYRNVAEILKDCDYVRGKNFGNYVVYALEKAGVEAMMSSSHEPDEWIDSLIESRYAAGYRD